MKIGLEIQKNPLAKCLTTIAVCSCISCAYAEFQPVAQTTLFTEDSINSSSRPIPEPGVNHSARPMPNPNIANNSRPMPDPLLGNHKKVVTELEDGTVVEQFEP